MADSDKPPTYRELADTWRDQAEHLVREAETLTATTLEHASQMASVFVQAAWASAQRRQELTAQAWRSWAEAARVSSSAVPALRLEDVKVILAASIKLAKGLLEAEQVLAERLVGAVAPGAR